MKARKAKPTLKCPYCNAQAGVTQKRHLAPHMTPGGLHCNFSMSVTHVEMIANSRQVAAERASRIGRKQ